MPFELYALRIPIFAVPNEFFLTLLSKHDHSANSSGAKFVMHVFVCSGEGVNFGYVMESYVHRVLYCAMCFVQ